MYYRKLGRTNLKVSPITLGTMTFGVTATEKESHRILDMALDMGINLIDTSNDYGNPNWGASETIIGNWLAKNPTKRDRIILATKVYQEKPAPHLPNEEAGLSAYKIHKQIEESLSRLQTDRIDLYQVHHLDRTICGEELWGSFHRLMNQGKVIYAGASNYNGWGLAKHQMQAAQLGHLGFVSEQTMYSLICRYSELDLMPCAEDFGIGILAYMPLAGGLLAGSERSRQDSRARAVMDWYGLDEAIYEPKLRDYDALCKALNMSGNALAIAWILANPAVASAIVGIRTVAQFNGLQAALEANLSHDTLAQLDTLFPIQAGKQLRNQPAPEAYAW
ncbi:aldo/keto reductase [Marinomonas sp. THO17]|uniref:aldo/keto reductase n=1 Tax=Marinomonas sp. THO17 TaxID=3149048 RepID=UPI00336BC021